MTKIEPCARCGFPPILVVDFESNYYYFCENHGGVGLYAFEQTAKNEWNKQQRKLKERGKNG